jgi:REP element-mobilizing transposase RayT
MSDRADNRGAHSTWLRAGRWSEAGACYAITKCVEGRRKLLAERRIAAVLTGCIDHLRRAGTIRLLGFCIMPDHVHVLFVLLGAKTLSEVMASFSRFTARQINTLLARSGTFWQEGFFDHRCRDLGEIEDQLSYFEHNPV